MKKGSERIKDYIGHTCRECINKKCGVHLRRSDCKYYPFKSICEECGEIGNVVESLRLSGIFRFRRENSEREIWRYLGYTCRDCINDGLNVNLKQNDCIHNIYKSKCSICGENRNIVVAIRLMGRLKLRFGKGDQRLTRMFGHYCLPCMSQKLGVSFDSGDCKYYSKNGICVECGRMAPIVKSMKYSGRVKTM